MKSSETLQEVLNPGNLPSPFPFLYGKTKFYSLLQVSFQKLSLNIFHMNQNKTQSSVDGENVISVVPTLNLFKKKKKGSRSFPLTNPHSLKLFLASISPRPSPHFNTILGSLVCVVADKC